MNSLQKQMLFHNKVKQVRTVQETEPNQLCVGILLHNRTPEEIENESDLVLVRCSGQTPISELQKIYMDQTKVKDGHLLFLYDGNLIEDPATKVAFLNTYGDNLVALEAIQPSQLLQRMPQHPEMLQIWPTTGQISAKNQSEGPRSVSEEPMGSALSNDSFKPMSPSLEEETQSQIGNHDANCATLEQEPIVSDEDLCGSVVTAAALDRSSSPQKLPCTLTAVDKDYAYMDFVCERRSAKKMQTPWKVMSSITAEIDRDWATVGSSGLRQHLERARSVSNGNASSQDSTRPAPVLNQRAFWKFYFDTLTIKQQQGYYPHRNASSTTAFHGDLCGKWAMLEKRAIRLFMDDVMSELLAYPIGPSPSFTTEGCLEVATLSSSPSVPIAQLRAPNSATPEPQTVPDNIFRQQSVEPQPAAIHIPSLFADASLEILEQGVDEGLQIFGRLKVLLAKEHLADDLDEGRQAAHLSPLVDAVERQARATRTKTVVGVVGNTGSGKSSTINAILDEERLVPTNCMRACTAVVTQISYNYGEAPYSAEIEFICVEDWRKELSILWKDLFDLNGNVSRECTKEDSEAGIAYAKIEAVYPKLTKEDISRNSIDQLMQHDNILNLLGTTKSFSTQTAADFYKQLQFYVDSKEKTFGDKRKNNAKKKSAKEMEFWPLIRVVRLYVRAAALSTGAVIVDLPGGHDSNQARAAVAEGYKKQCTGHWIVTPINRAVDDKTAKTLLGHSFKRQLKMDGGFNSVTFICSKTDDISITEASDSLGLEEQLGTLWEQCDTFSQQKLHLEVNLKELQRQKEDIHAVMYAADEDLQEWEALQYQQRQGRTVYPPSNRRKKRKRGQEMTDGPKRLRRSHIDNAFTDVDSSDESLVDRDSDEEEKMQRRAPLTEEDCHRQIAELRASKKQGWLKKQRLDNELENVHSELQRIERRRDDIDAQIRTICIAGRNQYSKGAIQEDFAAGIKETDQEVAEKEDDANFDPTVNARDYDEVARSLPVFCVSARGYQKLQGRFAKDSATPGFKTLVETEIPQLRAHCRNLAATGRRSSYQIFLNNLDRLLNSVKLWALNNAGGPELSSDQKGRKTSLLHKNLERLSGALQKSIRTVCDAIQGDIKENIYRQMPIAAEKARDEANNTANRWGSPVNHSDRAAGGYAWSTYKAICRRDGVYSNEQGLHDWNTNLSDPMLQSIVSSWEKTFSHRIPSTLDGLPITVENLLAQFHEEVETRVVQNGTPYAMVQMLSQQLQHWQLSFRDIATNMRTRISERSREINRQFVPIITDIMLKAYHACESECGPGLFLRMKQIMTRSVNENRTHMFNQSVDYVRASLEELVEDVESQMLEQSNQTFLSLKGDYVSALLSEQTVNEQQLPRAVTIRKDIADLVEEAAIIFKKVVHVEREDQIVDVGEANHA